MRVAGRPSAFLPTRASTGWVWLPMIARSLCRTGVPPGVPGMPTGAGPAVPRRSFSARMRAFRKTLVISPANACPGAAPASESAPRSNTLFAPHAVYQAFYVKGSNRKSARCPGRHALAGFLTVIFPETRTRRENGHLAHPTSWHNPQAGRGEAAGRQRDGSGTAAEEARRRPACGFRPAVPRATRRLAYSP